MGFILFLALIPAAICASVSRPGDCTDVYNGGSEDSGVYTIYTLGPVQVYCNIGCEEESVRWTVIQRRKDGNVNFLRGWDQYRSGFGEPSGGFWLRLENIHLLTQRKSYELKVVMEDFEGNKAYVYYSTFSVGPEEDGYRLQVSGFRNGRRGPAAENTSEDNYFKGSLLPLPCFFFIDHKDWTKLRKRQHLHWFKTLNWTSVLAKGIQSIHPLCSFGFKEHRVKSISSSRSGPVIVCLGYCLFDDCPVEVDIVVQEESSLKALVKFSGSFVHHRWDQDVQRSKCKSVLPLKQTQLNSRSVQRTSDSSDISSLDRLKVYAMPVQDVDLVTVVCCCGRRNTLYVRILLKFRVSVLRCLHERTNSRDKPRYFMRVRHALHIAALGVQASTSGPVEKGHHVACQTDPPTATSTRLTGTQLSMKTLQPHFRSTGTQTNFPSTDVGVGTAAALPFLTSTPIKRPRKRRRTELEEVEEEPAEGSYVDIPVPHDSTYDPVDTLNESADVT
ncbi:hypothetical protein JOB18_043041 [Solea senegalensis]|uniref:Fibrinogen C-terminal domain-containing protein n=1 Tax=Solea senegalensis TaxID=28829 RepID=A0AAV6PZR3_SOLSE|nr:hypothetical protein JOB18_043041 [Solea senegalensis]